MIDLAYMGVVPFCPKCGLHAMFVTIRAAVDGLVPVKCVNSSCNWEGVSRISVPQPKVCLQFNDLDPEAEA